MKFLKNQVSEKINLLLFKTGIEDRESSEVAKNRENLVRPALENLAVTDETEARLREVIDGPVILENLLFEYFKEFSSDDLGELEAKLKTVKAAGSLILWYASDNPKLLQALRDKPQLVTLAIENKGYERYLKNKSKFFKENELWTRANEALAISLKAEVDQRVKARKSRTIEA